MAIDFEKYGTVANDSSGGAALDFSKYGTPINDTPESETKSSFRFDVPESRAEKVSRFQNEAVTARNESKKANSLMEKYVKPVADSILPGVSQLGETIAGIKGAESSEDYSKTVDRLTNTQIELLRNIRANEKKGMDTTKLKKIYNQNLDALGNLKGTFDESIEGSQKSTKKVVGELGMTALNLLTAGTYGKATVGTKSFTLGGQTPGLVSATANILKKPSGLFTLRGASEVALGAGIGEAFDVTQNLQDDKRGFKILTDGYGKYIGAGLPVLMGAKASVANRFSSETTRRELGEVFRETAKRYTRSSVLLERAEAKHGTDPISVFEMYGKKTIPEMAEGGKLNPKEAVDFLDSKIGQLSQLKNDNLFLNDTRIGFEDYRKYVDDLIEAQPSWSDTKKANIRNDVKNLIDENERAYAKSVKNKSGLELSEWDRIKTEQTGLSKSYKNKAPKFDYDAHAILGKGARELIELFDDSATTRELNKFIQSHYDAIDLLNSWRGLTPKGGMMSKHFAKVGGDIVGFAAGQSIGHPFLGAMGGRAIASQLTDIVQSQFISNPIKRILINNLKEQAPDVVKNAIKALDERTRGLLDEINTGQKLLDESIKTETVKDKTGILKQIEDKIDYANKQDLIGMDGKSTTALRSAISLAEENKINFPFDKVSERTLNRYKGSNDFARTPLPTTNYNEIGTSKTSDANLLSTDELEKVSNPTYFSQGNDMVLPQSSNKTMSNNIKPIANANIDDTIPPMTYISQGLKEGKEMAQILIDYVKNPKLGMSIEDVSKNAYKGEKDLTTKILKDLEGKSTVSKQYILDATNRGELKQSERDITRAVLDTMPDGQINVKEFADKVKSELLPLEVMETNKNAGYLSGRAPKYENIALPDEIRGKVKNYKENIYQSPIKTSAGDVHFAGGGANSDVPNYFGHTRIEDMADNKTRRVIEVQSDLYQKGRLDDELGNFKGMTEGESGETYGKRALKREKEIDALRQYNDPTAHFRMVREELKKAAQDGKTKIQFPTGETALRIEGLVDTEMWNRGSKKASIGMGIQKLEDKHLRMGEIVNDGNTDWIVSNKLGEGKFKALPKDAVVSDLKKSFPNISEKEINDFIILCL